MTDIKNSEGEARPTCWVFFKYAAEAKAMGMEIDAAMTRAELETHIAQTIREEKGVETKPGLVAYWRGEAGQGKDAAWKAARAAQLRYVSPADLMVFKTHLPDMTMNQILQDLNVSEAAARQDMRRHGFAPKARDFKL